MLNTICREIISLITRGDSNKSSAALATVILFVLVVVLFFGILTTVNLIYLCCKDSDYKAIKIALLVIETTGALLYFYGDNIDFIFTQYGDVLGCGQQCVENNRIAAVITLGLALMFYHLFPPCLPKIAKLCKVKDKSTAWYSASDMMITILKVDALFTVVAIMAQTTDFCSKTDLSISIAFFIICVIIGSALMVVYCIFSMNKLKEDGHDDWSWIVPLAFIILVICFPMYVLADNLQPLDCAWGCDSFATNETLNVIGCNTVGNSALRLGFTLVTFIAVLVLSLLLFCCRSNTKGEKAI